MPRSIMSFQTLCLVSIVLAAIACSGPGLKPSVPETCQELVDFLTTPGLDPTPAGLDRAVATLAALESCGGDGNLLKIRATGARLILDVFDKWYTANFPESSAVLSCTDLDPALPLSPAVHCTRWSSAYLQARRLAAQDATAPLETMLHGPPHVLMLVDASAGFMTERLRGGACPTTEDIEMHRDALRGEAAWWTNQSPRPYSYQGRMTLFGSDGKTEASRMGRIAVIGFQLYHMSKIWTRSSDPETTCGKQKFAQLGKGLHDYLRTAVESNKGQSNVVKKWPVAVRNQRVDDCPKPDSTEDGRYQSRLIDARALLTDLGARHDNLLCLFALRPAQVALASSILSLRTKGSAPVPDGAEIAKEQMQSLAAALPICLEEWANDATYLRNERAELLREVADTLRCLPTLQPTNDANAFELPSVATASDARSESITTYATRGLRLSNSVYFDRPYASWSSSLPDSETCEPLGDAQLRLLPDQRVKEAFATLLGALRRTPIAMGPATQCDLKLLVNSEVQHELGLVPMPGFDLIVSNLRGRWRLPEDQQKLANAYDHVVRSWLERVRSMRGELAQALPNDSTLLNALENRDTTKPAMRDRLIRLCEAATYGDYMIGPMKREFDRYQVFVIRRAELAKDFGVELSRYTRACFAGGAKEVAEDVPYIEIVRSLVDGASEVEFGPRVQRRYPPLAAVHGGHRGGVKPAGAKPTYLLELANNIKPLNIIDGFIRKAYVPTQADDLDSMLRNPRHPLTVKLVALVDASKSSVACFIMNGGDGKLTVAQLVRTDTGIDHRGQVSLKACRDPLLVTTTVVMRDGGH